MTHGARLKSLWHEHDAYEHHERHEEWQKVAYDAYDIMTLMRWATMSMTEMNRMNVEHHDHWWRLTLLTLKKLRMLTWHFFCSFCSYIAHICDICLLEHRRHYWLIVHLIDWTGRRGSWTLLITFDNYYIYFFPSNTGRYVFLVVVVVDLRYMYILIRS